MKKVIALVTLLSLAVAFSCSVFAAGDGYYGYNGSATYTRTNTDVTVKVTAVQMAGRDDGVTYPTNTSSSSGGMAYTIENNINVLYSVLITNNGSSTRYINNLYFRPTFNEPSIDAVPGGVENFSNDFYAALDSTNGYIIFYPSSDFSFGNSICIPANTSLTCVFAVPMTVRYYNSSSNPSIPTISSLSFNNWTAYETDFTPQGAHDDILISLEALRNYLIGNTGIPAINTALSTIVSDMVTVMSSLSHIEGYTDDIERLLTWNASYTSPGLGSRSNATNTSISNVKVTLRNLGCVPITDFEILPPDVVITDVLYKHAIQIEIETSFTEDKQINGSFIIQDFMAVGTSTFDNPIIYSDKITVVGLAAQDGYYDAYVRYNDNIIQKGRNFNSIWIYVYSRSNSMPVNSSFSVNLGVNTYQSDLSGESDSLKTQTDNVHTQEQVYFNQNSQAIANTGLSNYRFGTGEGNGLDAVSNDFVYVWNALDGWTVVYVFSLVLTIALTIIRYTPNAIRAYDRKKYRGGS